MLSKQTLAATSMGCLVVSKAYMVITLSLLFYFFSITEREINYKEGEYTCGRRIFLLVNPVFFLLFQGHVLIYIALQLGLSKIFFSKIPLDIFVVHNECEVIKTNKNETK